MLTRRRFVGYSALSSAMLAYPGLVRAGLGQTSSSKPLRLAVIGSVYERLSAMQTIADRFLVGYPYDGEWRMPNIQVVSMYVDQQQRRIASAASQFDRSMTPGGRVAFAGTTPADRPARNTNVSTTDRRQSTSGTTTQDNSARRAQGGQGFGPAPDPSDLSRSRAEQFGFKIYRSIQETLRCGGDKIAVDAVLAIVDPDDYPMNDKGQVLLPSYDFFQQCALVFEEERHSVPYFNHNQLSFSYQEAQSMIKTAERLKIPILAGASLPVTWRLPDVDVPLGATVHEAVMVGVTGFNGTDFDALEAMQSMLERRKGGETGVKSVQLLEGDDVWDAGASGRWSKELLSSALSRSDTPMGLTLLDGRTQDLVGNNVLPQLVKDPAAYCIEYNDGTRATLLMLNGAIKDFNISVKVEGHGNISTQFFTPLPPNETYSACLAAKIEQLYTQKIAPYSAKRTLLTTGVLEAAMNSKHKLNQKLLTPHLAVSYAAPTESQYARG